ncbi:diguanylate cyclase [uncultured Lamprocystis sp.]|jgi:diguanylate cyclase (GGDEF)-like protein|uniref:diguanylate cyclase domain-containing protein n=1 Tax=uncultured Lamprocystis sp. TaxID=543132 RepID=UPI0025EBB5CF|nr:diguanylate cyclase [uncultured Lamprocystis sp.]
MHPAETQPLEPRVRILIVDDVPDNIRVLSRMLADEGHQISAATNGRQALKLAETCAPDLILLDVMMPEMNGYEACAALKADPLLQSIPIIFITALADAEDETRGLALGAVDYVTKPFKEAIVRLRVRTHLELKRQRDFLDQLSHIDGLTGIPNRRAFDLRLDHEWRRMLRSGQTLAAAMVDIDHFKEYNDAHGHLDGDDCLRRVAEALTQQIKRAGDFVGRYGGEEFICLLIGPHAEGLSAVSEQLRAGIEALQIPHGASPVSPWVTVSLGAAICQPVRHEPPANLIEAADRQLFTAKRLGRNRVSLTTI